MRLRQGKIIPREDGKRIEEFVGNATTRTPSVSVARMWAPPGWSEPAQTPEFDEVVVVLKGALTLVVNGKRERIEQDEVGLVPRGAKVVYRNDDTVACDYLSVCAPAFLPQLAHMEAEKTERSGGHQIQLELGHPRAKKYGGLLESAARAYLDKLKLKRRELSLSLVTDRAIRRINRTWRRKDQPTDVLSFPAGEQPKGTPGPAPIGDVVISLDTAERVAKENGWKVEDELLRYLAHGILHLLGHDHHKPKERQAMQALEAELLGREGLIPAGMQEAKRPARRKTAAP